MDWEKKRKYEAMKPSTTEQRNNEYLNFIGNEIFEKNSKWKSRIV